MKRFAYEMTNPDTRANSSTFEPVVIPQYGVREIINDAMKHGDHSIRIEIKDGNATIDILPWAGGGKMKKEK